MMKAASIVACRRRGIFHRVGEYAAQRVRVFRIHFLVLLHHGGRGGWIEPIESFERRANHGHRDSAECACFARRGRARPKAV